MLSGLETIDDDTDSLDIIFVKIKDSRYAKKYGLNKLPAVAYFRKRFPSVFRGEKYFLHFVKHTEKYNASPVFSG